MSLLPFLNQSPYLWKESTTLDFHCPYAIVDVEIEGFMSSNVEIFFLENQIF